MTKRSNQNIWPHNNRPSALHQMKVVFQNGSEFGERCQRCGCSYNTRVGSVAAIFCVPTKEWLEDHPNDTGQAGIGDTEFAALLGMGKR